MENLKEALRIEENSGIAWRLKERRRMDNWQEEWKRGRRQEGKSEGLKDLWEHRDAMESQGRIQGPQE